MDQSKNLIRHTHYEPKEIIEDAPAVINLEDSEKFVDSFDNIAEIEVRGERDYEKSYFKVKDIIQGFDIKRLNEYIVDTRRNGYKLAETDLKDAFCLMNFIFEHDTYKEIIIFNKTLMPKIKKQYESISKSYVGHIAGAISKMKHLENKHENELLKRDMEIVKDKNKYDNELLKRDMESAKDKHEIELLKKIWNQQKINILWR